MARLTIAWVKEYAKTNGIFLVKTSNGYCVQYQRLIDELTYEDSVGYRAVFKTLKETKDWIDDQNPVDVLGIDKEVAKEIYEDAKNFSDKVDRDMGVDREEENYNIPELDPRYDGKFWNVESIGMSYQEDYTPLEWYEKLIKTGRDKHAEWWLNQHSEIKNVEVREYAQSIFPYLEITDNKSIYDAIMNWRDSNRFIKEGEGFLPALPLWELNNSNELNSLKFLDLAAEYLAYIERIERKEFNEVREYAENCGYTLLELSECEYCNFTLCSTNGVGEFTALVDVVEAIKDGRMLNKEFSALPLLKSKSLKITPCHKSISLENGEFTTVKDFKLSAIANKESKILTLEESVKIRSKKQEGRGELKNLALQVLAVVKTNKMTRHDYGIDNPLINNTFTLGGREFIGLVYICHHNSRPVLVTKCDDSDDLKFSEVLMDNAGNYKKFNFMVRQDAEFLELLNSDPDKSNLKAKIKILPNDVLSDLMVKEFGVTFSNNYPINTVKMDWKDYVTFNQKPAPKTLEESWEEFKECLKTTYSIPANSQDVTSEIKNNLEEEIKEDMALTKESNAAIKLLVKYDFTTQALTQFEVFALTSLKKYVESGIESKLIKTFADTLIKKLSEEEKISLRDKALGEVFKNKERLKTILEIFSENDRLKEIMAKDENELSDTEAQIKLKHLRSLNLI